MSQNCSHHDDSYKALGLALVITTSYLLIELVVGVWSGSLALVSDAAHMGGDSFALLIGWVASYFGQRRGPREKKRIELISAFLNGSGLLLVAIWVLLKAAERIESPLVIEGSWVLVTAILGLLVNLYCASLLHREQHKSLSLKAAYLHIVFDLLGSLAAIFSGLMITWKQWYWVDPLVSALVVILMIISGSRILKDCYRGFFSMDEALDQN